MTWTHNGAPLGPKPRPWRLTRRQRVEMEAALAGLRGGGGSNFYGWVMAADRAASVWGRPGLARFTVDELERWGRIGGLGKRAYEGAVRITRARVAIALRAALRADEDARCEESWAMMGTVRLPREWPGCMIFQGSAVPLALWERAR